MYNKGPFAHWVPKPVMLLLMMIILFPMMAISGSYTTIASDLYGAMSVYPEYISLAFYAGSVGMGLSIMIMMRVKMRFRSKEIIVVCSLLLALLSYMCGTTEDPRVLVVCSFLIGFLKMFPMIEILLPVMFMITPTGDRGKFYSVFYPLSIGFGQLSGYCFSSLVYNGSWERPYILMTGLMLLITLLSLIFQHNQRFSFKMPLHQIDWLSLVMLASSYMLLVYFFIFMKQQAWFTSPYITGSLALSLILFLLLIYRQKFLKRKMIHFECFRHKNVIHGTILLLFMGIYLGSSTAFSQFTLGILGYNNLINADINLWMLPGIVMAGIMASFGFKYQWPVKYYIGFGFVCLFLHTLSLYLLIQPQMDIRYLEYTMIIKGLGMATLFIGIWFYTVLGLSQEKMLGIMAVLIPIRSAISTAVGSALVGWATYQGQWQSLSDISNYLDSGNIQDGMGIYQNINYNAMMASSKIVLGSLCWLIVPVLIFIFTHSYGNFNIRRIIMLRKMVRGNSMKGYKLS
ncbi:Major Facilitator Superfamily protein [Chryseobacterium taichungense]|uniref:Major Facilitator Superfamily protein n=1 Tax=Chryseobacterium taichungense TaxID=295069 RepID=A0A1H7XDS0_9FLAO|nr:MFS transporter [Chryseobacterium taichungense]SEM31930.1 Major Facilitator Superfamily protein [Chryseobacterium taichungense]